METRSTILSELKDISPAVANISAGLPYEVPQGYFEGLAAAILARIQAGSLSATDELETISPLLNGISRQHPFQVPAGYFAELSENIIGGARAIDFVNGNQEGIAPVLDGLQHKATYQAPVGYFGSLPETILANINKQQPAKVVSMSRRIVRYAAAAVITGAIAISGWLYFNNSGATGTGTETAQIIEKIGSDKTISDEEISSYLETATIPVMAVNTVQVADEEMDSADLKDMLTDVSEDEIQQYLTTL